MISLASLSFLCFSSCIAINSLRSSRADRVLFMGLGVAIGLVLHSLCFYVALLCFSAITPSFYVLSLAVGLVLLTPHVFTSEGHLTQRLGVARQDKKYRHAELSLLVFILVYGGYMLTLGLLSVAQAWDFLGHWSNATVAILSAAEGDFELLNEYEHRHPLGVPIFMASFSLQNQMGDVVSPLVPAWLVLWVCIVLLAGGVVISAGGKPMATLLAAGLTTSPLTENHALLYGYSELPLALCMLSAHTAYLLALRLRKVAMFLLVGMFSFAACLTKNVGFVYALPVFFVALISFAAKSNRSVYFAIAGVFSAVGVALLATGSLEIDSDGISVGARALRLGDIGLLDVLLNHWHAFLVNSSFGVSLVVIILALVILCRKAVWKVDAYDRQALVAIAVPAILIFFSQIFEYGFQHAMPGADTGGSRFWVPVIITALPLCLSVIIKAEASEVAPK